MLGELLMINKNDTIYDNKMDHNSKTKDEYPIEWTILMILIPGSMTICK